LDEFLLKSLVMCIINWEFVVGWQCLERQKRKRELSKVEKIQEMELGRLYEIRLLH